MFSLKSPLDLKKFQDSRRFMRRVLLKNMNESSLLKRNSRETRTTDSGYAIYGGRYRIASVSHCIARILCILCKRFVAPRENSSACDKLIALFERQL